MASSTEENYLKALLKLSKDNGQCSVSDLSHLLKVSTPTANSMIKKLADKNWILYEKYKPIQLTDLGRKMAALVIRKHRLTEMFLVEQMGFGWEEVHEIAEQIEHLQSPIFFEKMDALLGHPKTDPHGSPIPDKSGKMEWLKFEKLSDCKTGDTVKLSAVLQTSDEFLKFLSSKELTLGQKIKVKHIEKFDGSMTVSYGNKTAEMLSHTVSERLLVEKV